MYHDERWLMPDGIDELLPPVAEQFERLRRDLLDGYAAWGYTLVVPPLVEFIESLLVGAAHDLALQTFVLTDQLSGRTLGVRADITPQVARIDAHRLRGAGIARLCYLGSVLRTKGDGFGGSRSPHQTGVELYGYSGIEGDVEVMELMVATLRTARLEAVHLDLGHVGIFRALTAKAALDDDAQTALFDALQRKAKDEVQAVLDQTSLPLAVARSLEALVDLHGDPSLLARAKASLLDDPEIALALDTLERTVEALQRRLPDVSLTVDLGEVRGYRYHTGLLFAAYAAGQGQEVARGGRYDGIGRAFGRARPATGFSTDLKTLLTLAPAPTPGATGIAVAWSDDPALQAVVADLRRQGERVVWQLPGAAEDLRSLGCDRRLVISAGQWRVEAAFDG
ncbi:MAG: ATP phosphoribosyltransferase regulatory subunit [Candidatus Competibacterales bacterium]